MWRLMETNMLKLDPVGWSDREAGNPKRKKEMSDDPQEKPGGG